MSNALITFEDMAAAMSNMNFEQRQALVNMASIKQVESLTVEVKAIQNKIEGTKIEVEQLKNDIEESKREHENMLELERKRHRSTEFKWGFINASDLGQCFATSIGSITMGKLLRLAGLAKAKQSRTEPMREAIVNNYAKSNMLGNNLTYLWNPEKCINKIDKWLTNIGVIDKFYSIEDEEALKEYIKELEAKYGNRD